MKSKHAAALDVYDYAPHYHGMTTASSQSSIALAFDRVRTRRRDWIKASQALANVDPSDSRAIAELQLIERSARLLLDLAVDRLDESIPAHAERHQLGPISHPAAHH